MNDGARDGGEIVNGVPYDAGDLVVPTPPYAVGDLVTVTKLNWRGEIVYSWQGDVQAHKSNYVLIRAVWRGPGTVELGHGVVFAPGCVFYEHYDAAKPYGLWQVYTPDESQVVCWYCNIETPAVFGNHAVSFRDLLLDVLVMPDGRCDVLDRDDLARALVDGLDPALGALAEKAVADVIGMVERRAPPFDDGPTRRS